MAVVRTAISSITKAREAQKKFEENKKKVEAAKKRAEEAIKKAKALQQRIKETQALFRATGGVSGGIAAIAASQIGNIRGALVTQVQKQVLSMLNKFSNECPSPEELKRIIKTRSTLLKHLSSFEKRVGKYNSLAKNITRTVRVVTRIIRIITSIPLPTAIIPPLTGGLGIPINVLTKYSNALIKLNKTLDRLLGEATAITGVVSSVNPITTNLKSRLSSIDTAIEQCSNNRPADLLQILETAQPQGNTGSEGISSEEYVYKGYTLAIILDPNSPKIAPRRYAIASDRQGVVRLKGDSSFSSSIQVLLDEIKFKIDNQFT
jgi:hypothetical protein